MKVLDVLNRIVQALAAAFLAVMTVLVLIQVFFRYALGDPLGSPQELSIYCMAWVIMLGASAAVRHDTHISVTFVVARMPPPLRRLARWVNQALVVTFFAILAWQGWLLTTRAMLQMSPTTGIPVGWIVLAIPLCSVISIAYVVDQIARESRKDRNGPG